MFDKKLTYISLFSSGGIGCFGFKQEGFECIATVEIIKKRLDVQKANKKCKYDSGYINDDITESCVKEKLYDQINFWKQNEKINDVTVIIATPPCQGMSTANSKKNSNDILRNSLIVDSIEIINKVKPIFFIFENVHLFMKSTCLVDGEKFKIGDYIYSQLSKNYSIFHNVINFKDYGSNSSRKRCLVIGVRNDISHFISPIELFPDFNNKCKTIRDLIFDKTRFTKMGDIDPKDIFHFFRKYKENMRSWITNLKEGMSAYENKNINEIPHHIKNNIIVLNKNKMGGKYKRQIWDQVAPCIHTRNDQLASQNTIHPEDDRVFSIRELMIFMTVPNNFKWVDTDEIELNNLSFEEKTNFLKKHENNIRKLLGEAVPTKIFQQIANKIKVCFNKENRFFFNKLKKIEYENPLREFNEAYYTDKFIINEIVKKLPDFSDKEEIFLLEPSVGLGSFLPLIFKKYQHIKKVHLDVIDIDTNILNLTKKIIKKIIPKNFEINFFNGDFLLNDETSKLKTRQKYDLVFGNPPFNSQIKGEYKKKLDNIYGKQKSRNSIVYFLLKSIKIANFVSFVLPKNFLSAFQYNEIRNQIKQFYVLSIIDFGKFGFKNVVLETINLIFSPVKTKDCFVEIKKISDGTKMLKKRNYIFGDSQNKFPNWIIYRDKNFDYVYENLDLDIFDVYRDRQITNKFLTKKKIDDQKWVLRSRNLTASGEIINIDGYDKFIDETHINNFYSSKFLNNPNVYICPNFTNNIRVLKKPENCLVNGSVAIFIPKIDKYSKISNEDLKYFSSKEFIDFFKTANNFLENTINIDKNLIFYFGLKKGR